MVETSLLFDQSYAFLGEVATQDGAMRRVMFTTDGERRMEVQLRDWQARGVPVLREVTPSVSGNPMVFFQERVQVRHSEFLSAMRQWVEHHGMALVQVPNEAMECWEIIVRLPLDPREQFLLLVSLRKSTPAELKACKADLIQAVDAAEAEYEKARNAIKTLWDRAAKELVAQFAG